ncbi:MAG: amino acid aminotransferase [Candidatus Roseilinea sp.]|uniref:amino acid aminotransferase n=1 Tax=Candidatus Roseilinea sp. TaxID=2838777 RepID=UPI00404A4F1A
MFETLPMAPADPILGLTEAFNKDPNPNKINLSVGVYKDAEGKTPVFRSVKRAEERILQRETSKNYMPIEGAPDYARAVQALVMGADHPAMSEKRVATVHTPGGTGALRVAGDFIKQMLPGRTVWLSNPTWPNHPNVFKAAGLPIDTYPYFDAAANALDFDAMTAKLKTLPEGDIVLLHGCCHNPTGIDPTPEQWQVIDEILDARKLLPLIDFAYQGLGDGLDEDAAGVRALCRPGREMLICSSFSKNFGLYNERVGALTVVAANEQGAQIALSQLKACIRANYSNPPAHGAAIVTTILNDAGLRAEWESEVKDMRDRINGMRALFVDTLKAKGVQRDFSFLKQQRGMFSFSGLTKEQVETLRQKYAIYILGSGRINVAGMTESNMELLCNAIADVLR